ncbi:hypothetical protein IWW42_001308 [Coemansia sp. RSA 1085]|nr:hypothetical protein IWW42_001308 [Coemansia sp. RSA 1085]
MTKGNRIEFELDQPDIVLRGMADESQGAIFSGRLVVHLSEPIRVKGLKMALEGHELLQWEYHNDGAISTFYRETTPLSHTWTFFTTANGKKVETWDAGRHEFPFSLIFPGSLPETIKIPYANVAYFLKATLRRTGIMHNITAKREVAVKRDLAMDGGIGTGAVDVENRWHEMMDFSITSDADTFTPGDRLRARFAFQPLVKHLRLDRIGVVLKEYVRCHAPSGHAEKTVSRVAAHAEVIPNPESAITGFGDSSAPGAPQHPLGTSTPQPQPQPQPLSKALGKRPEHHGVDLTTALEEHVSMAIPTTDRRLQYDHISSYIEITHKLKFSISFHDPEDKPHTLWVSVPVSIVPTIVDEAHHAGPELPSYQKAALDQRVAIAGIEPSPPAYDAVIAESLSHAASPAYSPACSPAYSPALSTGDEQSLDSAGRAGSSSPASAHSRDEAELLDVSTMGTPAPAAQAAVQGLRRAAPGGLLQPELVRVSRTRLAVDASRPPVHPSAVHNFLRRPVVFPASAEATPMATPPLTPAATPMASPLLKGDDPLSAPHNVHSVPPSTSTPRR